MAERGDVLELRGRLGFGAKNQSERVVVVQATPLNSRLDLLAAPYQGRELLVHVPAAEAGTKRDQVAIVTHRRFAPSDRFEPGRVGKLGPETLEELDEKLRLVLDL